MTESIPTFNSPGSCKGRGVRRWHFILGLVGHKGPGVIWEVVQQHEVINADFGATSIWLQIPAQPLTGAASGLPVPLEL